jgi:hypothetical protein
MFSSDGLSLAAGKMRTQELTCHRQAASSMILKNHRRLPVCIFSVKIAALGPWVFEEGIERIFKTSK